MLLFNCFLERVPFPLEIEQLIGNALINLFIELTTAYFVYNSSITRNRTLSKTNSVTVRMNVALSTWMMEN
jgi:hypothetical protein